MEKNSTLYKVAFAIAAAVIGASCGGVIGFLLGGVHGALIGSPLGVALVWLNGVIDKLVNSAKIPKEKMEATAVPQRGAAQSRNIKEKY